MRSCRLVFICICVQAAWKPLYLIPQAGEWKSPAFLKYLDLVALDRDMVVQAHLDEESEDDDL